jgi:hypothetical protein
MTKANLDKRMDDDGILLDAQLEWEHEEGKREINKNDCIYEKDHFLAKDL